MSNNDSVWTKRIGLALCLLAGACDGDAPETFQELELRTTAFGSGGGGFINNGLAEPETSGIDTKHALTTDKGLKASKLTDANRLATARYVVECALPAGESVNKVVSGSPVVLQGALGLAPEWKNGQCGKDCKEWVSACLLARTNVSGQTVGLWLNADHAALGFGANPSYPHYEASFFGNLFEPSPKAYLCVGGGSGPVNAQLDGRTCSTGTYCGFTAYTNCEAVSRCEMVEDEGNSTAVDCRPGNVPGGPGMRTISTYVATPAG